jgi:hypothetical protein
MAVSSASMRLVRLLFLGCLVAHTCAAQSLKLPPRATNASPAKELVRIMTPMTLPEREDYIFQQVTNGNVPEFLRKLVPITISGSNHVVRYYVTPDYFALGSDADYLLTPMTPMLARRIDDVLDCTQPTRKMVNQIWKEAPVKLIPSPLIPGAKMITVPVFEQHNEIVRTQRLAQITAHPLGELVAGDKKDVVISTSIYTNLHSRASTPVVIYGWHKLEGTPIQPLYNGHAHTWADYSHGIRLVQQSATLDGKPARISAILTNAELASLLSDETNYPGNVVPKPFYPAK